MLWYESGSRSGGTSEDGEEQATGVDDEGRRLRGWVVLVMLRHSDGKGWGGTGREVGRKGT